MSAAMRPARTSRRCTPSGCQSPLPGARRQAATAAPEDGYLHAAFESTDVEALGAGAEWLQQRGWVKSWGIGRHVLGSQLFCYHIDPRGFEVEHYTDGDLFDAG
jgi:hypothetical protein